MSAGSNLPDGVRDEDIPGNSRKDAFIDNYLDSHIDELLAEYIADIDNKDLIDKAILDSPAYDEYIMSLPFDIIDSIGAFKHDHLTDLESIIELSKAFQTFTDYKASEAWIEFCGFKQYMRREED